MTSSRWCSVLIWIAGGALLVAVAVDVLAMLGRQIRLPLIGSIEIVEAAVLFAAAGALIVTTLDGAHARVNLLLDRVSAGWRDRLLKLHAIAAVVLFAALLAGTLWIAADGFGGHEVCELLRIPYLPLRLATGVCFAVRLLLSLQRLLGRDSR
jgi:TRAP-type C4-dicarboxylate transport system permease small subunit